MNLQIFFLALCAFFVSAKTKHKAEPTVCGCQNVTLTGSNVHTTRMGTFVFVPDVLHDGHAIYINDHHEYLYFYSPIWLVGNDYTKNMAGVRSNGNGLCPTDVPGWEHYVEGKWMDVPLEVTCLRAPKRAATKKWKQGKGLKKTGRSKKPDTAKNGKWKLLPTHGDKELLVVKKKDRVSQEVFAHYRKSMDRAHQITMLDKDCDSPLPDGVVMYDCVDGAVIDDIQSITVVIDVNFVAAQKARLWALCIKLALLADSVKNSTSDTVKTVAEHFTLMNLVSHDGMDELTMERVAALDRGISRLGRNDEDYRIKQLGKALDVVKYRFSQHTPDHHGESCSRETLDDFAKTRQILWGLEHQLADLSEAIEVEKQVESGHVPSAPEPKSIGNKWGTKSPQLYFKLEVCQCNFSSVTETSSLPLCLFHPLEPSMGFDFCLALDSDKIHIKRVVAVKFTVATSSTNELVLMPVDRQAGPQETLIRYFGRFTSLRTMATLGLFRAERSYSVEVQGTVILSSPEPNSKMNDISVDFGITIPINRGSPPAAHDTDCSSKTV